MKGQAVLFPTNPQPPLLFSGSVAESRATSKAAAVSTRESGRGQIQREQLLALYQRVGRSGITDKHAAAKLGLKHHTIPPRRKELGKLGIALETTGERRDGGACWRIRTEPA